MSELYKWQIISFLSRMAAMVIGIVQTFFIINIISKADYGVVQIALAIGGTYGIYQHLGLASGSTREIASAKDDTEVFKIFTTATVIRYFVTIPIAIFIYLRAPYWAFESYNEPQLLLPLRLFAFALLFQGMQSMLNSIISGTKRFKHLFLYQALISFVSIGLYIPLVYIYGLNGYFYAFTAFNIIATLSLSVIALKPLRASIELPSREDFKRLLKQLFSITLAIYAVKVILTVWEKTGPRVLPFVVSAELVAVFSVALLYGKKLMNISDSVTDVNLPVFSEKYASNLQEFKSEFVSNFNKLFVLTIFTAVGAVFWSQEVFHIVFQEVNYDEALPLVAPLVFTFIFYSFVNILKSSVLVPARLVFELIAGFVALLGVTYGFYYYFLHTIGPLNAMAYGMLAGALAGFFVILVGSQNKLSFSYFGFWHALLLLFGAFFSFYTISTVFFTKLLVFFVFCALYLCFVIYSKFVSYSDIKKLLLLLNKFR